MPKSQFINPDELLKPGYLTFQDIPIHQYRMTIEEEKERFSSSAFVRIYHDMVLIRTFEEMLQSISKTGSYCGIHHVYRGPSHLAIGQEALYVGQAYCLSVEDMIFGSHRNHGDVIAKGLSAIQQLDENRLLSIMQQYHNGQLYQIVKHLSDDVKQQAVAFLLYGTLAEIFNRSTGFNRGCSGSMHVFFTPFGIYPNNAIVGASAPLAAGAALYQKIQSTNHMVVANIGDGSLGCGVVYEAMNFSAMDQYAKLWKDAHPSIGLPILFCFSNNGYGMGGQTRGETMAFDTLARIGAGISPTQLHAERVNGNDPLAVIDAVRRKRQTILSGQGPALLDIVTYRTCSHSSSDQAVYREEKEVEAWQVYDPIAQYRNKLLSAGIASAEQLDQITAQTKTLVLNILTLAVNQTISPPIISITEIEDIMYSNTTLPQNKMAPQLLKNPNDCSRVVEIAQKVRFCQKDGKLVPKEQLFTLGDALFESILHRFCTDSSFISYGEELREWGGSFGVYRGLDEIIPYSRLFNTPISEAAIVGTAVGYAMAGGHPLIEIMYSDFIGRAGDEIFNQLAKWQSMSGGEFYMPVVLRTAVGSKYGTHHSQEWTSLVAHIPGLKVLYPATPYEAKGLLNAALAGSDPVIFFESQRLYDVGEQFHKGGVPKEYYELPIGVPVRMREGKDLTILTVGPALYRANAAARQLAKEGISCDIFSLSSLVPLDDSEIIASAKKTRRVVLVSDAVTQGSFLNDIAMRITQKLFTQLKAAPLVIGAKNCIIPSLEYDDIYYPQANDLIQMIKQRFFTNEENTCYAVNS